MNHEPENKRTGTNGALESQGTAARGIRHWMRHFFGIRDGAETLRDTIEELSQAVPEDVLAPYLALAVSVARGAAAPDEDELARVYGSSSPSRIRRLLEHMERQGLIVVREEFGGGRTIIVVGLEELAGAVHAS